MSALVERGEAHAVAFWGTAPGDRRDERMTRYVKALGPETA
jgi:hypothetical protein